MRAMLTKVVETASRRVILKCDRPLMNVIVPALEDCYNTVAQSFPITEGD
jgi:hypothetical protein